jgi:hypothetical protein
MWKALWQRVVVEWWPSVGGILVGALIQAVNTIQPTVSPQAAMILSVVAILLGALMPSKKQAAAAAAKAATPPQGFADWQALAFVSMLALAGVWGCATLKGASASTTVYTQDGKSYTLTVGDAGGCVVGAGWYAIPKTPFECSKVCVDVNPGALTPGATCRLVGRPETEFQVQVPIPTKGA